MAILLHWHCATKSYMMSIIKALSSNCTNKVTMKKTTIEGEAIGKLMSDENSKCS